MTKVVKIFFNFFVFIIVQQLSANNLDFDIKANGNIGLINHYKFDIYNDWSLKGRVGYKTDNQKYGIVSTIDRVDTLNKDFYPEIFIFDEIKNIGRFELGFTNSSVYKLSYGLSDVGDTNINKDSILYYYLNSNQLSTYLTSGHNILRLNFATFYLNDIKYGVSFSTFSNKYDYLFDLGLKYKNSINKIKYGISFGSSFIKNPNNFITNLFGDPVFAKSRIQGILALNIWYNSLMLSTTTKLVYDDNKLFNTDGIIQGISLSYNILNYKVSISNIVQSNIWNKTNFNTYYTTMLSLSYIYNSNVNIWMSSGLNNKKLFIVSGSKFSF